MKKITLISLAAAFAMGCSDASTGPSFSDATLAAPSSANFLANFPPPPMAFSGDVSSEYTSFSGTYFLNPTGLTGWISFSQQQPTGTTVTANARITYKNGSVTGTGTLVLSSTNGGAPLTIDLKTAVVGGQWSSTCNASCGSLVLQGTTLRETVKVTETVTVNLRNPAYNGEVVFGDYTHG
jgi:hypothetical protein